MHFEIIKASAEYKDVIKNLMQFYIYDFSEFIQLDVEENGLFEPYQQLDAYWQEADRRFPYIIKTGKHYTGFVFVSVIESAQGNYYSIAEFFILKKYRRQGMGKAVAVQIFDQHRGAWQVYQKESNRPAQQFWLAVIKEYTNGKFTEEISEDRRTQYFDNSSVAK
jgi:predicted acetyltransferase